MNPLLVFRRDSTTVEFRETGSVKAQKHCGWASPRQQDLQDLQ